MVLKCNRCRTSNALDADSYCLGCSAWEGLGRELQAPWGNQPCRELATEFLVNTARQVRALRNLSANLVPKADQGSRSGAKRPEEDPKAVERPALQRKRPHSPTRGASAKSTGTPKRAVQPTEEESSSEGSGETEELAVPEDSHAPLTSGDNRKPPEPDGAPPGYKESKDKEPRRERRRHHHHKKEDHPWRQHTKKPHRAGRKHQRLARATVDPFQRIHRKIPSSFFDIRLSDQGRAALE